MDAKEWDRISDLLMQIRAKVDNLLPTVKHSEYWRECALREIAALLVTIDQMAELDAEGWL